MRGLTLIGLLFLNLAWALPNHELVDNLRSRLHALPRGGGSLIKSYHEHSQSYIYDQALAIIAFSREKDFKSARELMLAMKKLQLPDGSFYFSYYLDGKSPYPQEGDRRLAGAIAWVALAASHFQYQFKTKEFVSMNHQALLYLKSEIKPLTVNGQGLKALRFAPHDLVTTPWQENDTAALEHNLDAYAAFLHFDQLNPGSGFARKAGYLKSFVLSMWDHTRSHFWSGASFSKGQINKQELYLDNQTWTLLALDNESLKKLPVTEALDLNCEALMVEHEGVVGFMDSRPTKAKAKSKFVWSEGTAGQVLAMKRAKDVHNVEHTCLDRNREHFLANIRKMKSPQGGIAYATKTDNPDFTTSSSVAGTAWLYFASNDFNPFHMEEAN